MIDNRFERTSESSLGEITAEEQRRLLELELIKIRSEASAARLEARAAEIEWMIRQLAAGKPAAEAPSAAAPGATAPGAEAPGATAPGAEAPGATAPSATAPINSPHLPTPAPFGSWDDVRSASLGGVASAAVASTSTGVPSAAPDPSAITRIDSGQTTTKAPHFLDQDDEAMVAESDESAGTAADSITDAIAPAIATSPPEPLLATDRSDRSIELVKGEVTIESEQGEDEEEHRRGKPAAWLVSAIAHVAVLLILAAVSLQTQRPKDQIALSASATEANQVSMETFSIESSEPEPDVTEPTPSETEYELSPVGQIAAADFAPDAPPAPPSPAAAAMSSSAMSSSAAMSLQSDSDAKIQFCGVEGGGNHFVYLVDSSKSMRGGFESARSELLASIAVLKPDQRFYVVFFDEESDYMRLSSANQDEPTSVYATSENKAALKRWAMRITKNDGRAPYDPLEFALELKPDVIFLLSDGEFPQGIEDLLREKNKVENLFGDSHPISIVHTIGYHSKQGESRMRRIAAQNEGQYRYIPKP